MINKVRMPKLFLAIVFCFIQFPVFALIGNSPLNSFTDFSVANKSSNMLSIKVTIPNSVFNSADFQTKVFDELNSTGIPYIYQSKLIAIPQYEDVEITIKHIDSILIPVDKNTGLLGYHTTNLPIVYLEKPGIMRDLRVAPLAVRQYYYNKTSNSIIAYNNTEIQLQFKSPPQPISTSPAISEAWAGFYNNSTLNFDESDFNIFDAGFPQGYLIIVDDALYNGILSFAQWKNLKGYTVTVKRKSEVGSSSAAIRSYIQQAYETWTPRLEYVLLVGSASAIPSYPIPYTANVGDHYYSCVAGDDLYPDLFIGRLPAANTSELSVIVAKIFGYEKTPYLSDTLWFRRGLMVGTQYSTGQPVWTALATLRWVRNELLAHNYLEVDTVFDPPNQGGALIDTFVNRGVTFVNGRGWGNYQGWHRPQFYTNNVYNLNNGWKLPIVTSFYCGTGNFPASGNFGVAWLIAGTPTVPKGAVAFYGPTYANTSSRFNNCQDYGVYWGIFNEHNNNVGPAMFRGKIEMIDNFVMPADTMDLQVHVCTYNILGDPSLEMWTGKVPEPLTVNYPAEIPTGSSSITVSVANSLSQPITGALVSLYKVGEIKSLAYSDNSGNATFNFVTQTSDTLFVTVTKHNYIPYLGNVRVTTSPVYIGYVSNSGDIIAGQTTNLSVSLKNFGSTQSATNTYATLRTQDNHITILDSIKSYGDIAPGQIISGSPFQFLVALNCTNNHRINFQIYITSGSNNWQAAFNTYARAPELSYKSHLVNDGGNQILEPGETSNLLVKILNHGVENISNITGILRCTNPWAIRVLDSTGYFGTIAVGDSVQNNSDYFMVQASSSVGVGRKFYFSLVLRNTNGYERVIEFPVEIGVVASNSALGPDNYGYWAYDNTDIAYAECPVYNWVEIDPSYGGSGTRIYLHDDDIKVINLPFTFRYYGINYNRISVCSNGYMSMDSSWIVDQYNWNIPSAFGPPAMIAPMWDDFHPDTLGASGVYYYNDNVNHRFIVEWSRVRHIHGFRDPAVAEFQTFQVILLNPTYYPTQTGDGPIIFQYNTVFNDDSLSSDCHNYATVGIENSDHITGIEYTFANRYPIAAAQLESNRAIKFTTNYPDTFTAINEPSLEFNLYKSTIKISISPNPFKLHTAINYSIPVAGNVSLSVYDANGRLINTIVDDYKNQGMYQVSWPRKNIVAGVYFAVLTLKTNNNMFKDKSKIVIY